MKINVDWRHLWIEKSDYWEEKYREIKGVYPLIDESFNYFKSMLEVAIFSLKNIILQGHDAYIQHRRFNENFDLMNKKIDVKERDVAEYLKNIFFNNEYKDMDINKFLISLKDFYNFDLSISRILFPNYYFDKLEKIIDKKCDEASLLNIISSIDSFRDYVLNIIKIIEDITGEKKEMITLSLSYQY